MKIELIGPIKTQKSDRCSCGYPLFWLEDEKKEMIELIGGIEKTSSGYRCRQCRREIRFIK